MATPAAAATQPIPSPAALMHAARIAIDNDIPIQLDYYADSLTGKAFMGEDTATKVRFLMKDLDEYTTIIKKASKVGDDFLIQTKHTLYIVSVKMQLKKLSMDMLHADEDDM
jgi:hypothetical protein